MTDLSPAAARWRRPGDPRPGLIDARNPSSCWALAGEATTWRTSPGRYCPVTTGSIPAPVPRPTRRATSRMLTGVPEATLYAANAPASRSSHGLQGTQVGAGDVVDVHEVAHLPAVLEHPRRLAALQRGAEDRGDAGVRRVPRHAGPVHVVVPQRDDCPVGLPGPSGRVVLLGDLAGGVRAPRGERRRLLDHLPAERAVARRAVVLEVAGLQCGYRPRGRLDHAVLRRRRSAPRRTPPSTTPAPSAARRARPSSPAMRRLRGRCGRRTPAGRPPTTGPDQRGLVAHDVDPVEQVRPLGDVADVEPVQSRDVRRETVRQRQQHVDRHDLVPLLAQQPRDGRADKAGRTGEQDPHGIS